MTFADFIDHKQLMHVAESMREHTANFITPISVALEHTYGQVVGSGTFIELRGTPYILTNEHVAVVRQQHRLAHFVDNEQPAVAVVHPFQCITEPTDAALARIDAHILQGTSKSPVPQQRIAAEFAPVQGEIMFIHGYPGRTSHFSATLQTLLARTCPYATDVAPIPDAIDSDLHFALHYPAPGQGTTRDFHGNVVDLPDPQGLSGTLVWDTKYVANHEAGWSPNDAEVVGVVHRWHQLSQRLIATKIEVIRVFLIDALRKEAAYFRWNDRGEPEGDDWTDWFWAVSEIDGL